MFPPRDYRDARDGHFPRPTTKYFNGAAVDVPMRSVSSTAILRAGYDEEESVMAVEFISSLMDNKVYFFRTVPKEVWEAFLEAPSKGRFFQEHIRSNIGNPTDGGYEWCYGHVANR